MNTLRKAGAIVIVALALSSCSFGLRLAYNNLDWLVERELDDYIALSGAQARQFEQAFEAWWHWHRSDQLPEYARTLRALAERSRDGVDATDLQTALEAFERAYLAAMERGYPAAVALLRSLDEQQVQDLREELREELEDYADDALDNSPEKRQRERIKRTRKLLRSRLGRLNDAQDKLIADATAELEDLTEPWIASQRAWQQRFTKVLATRAEPEFAADLRPLLFNPGATWPPALAQAVARNQQRRQQMLLAVLDRATPAQLRHLEQELIDLAEICERLAPSAPVRTDGQLG